MNGHGPPGRQPSHPHSESNKSPALALYPGGNIWASSPAAAQQGWSDAPERWSQPRTHGPLQPSHNIPSTASRDEKDVGAVARGDLLKDYQRMKEDSAEQARRPRVGAIGEGRAGAVKMHPPPHQSYRYHALENVGPDRERAGPNNNNFNGLSLDLSSLQISNNSPASSPVDGTSSAFLSTPSLSTKSNTPTTPQDPHGSFSSHGAKTPEDDPSLWINPALKNTSSSRFMSGHWGDSSGSPHDALMGGGRDRAPGRKMSSSGILGDVDPNRIPPSGSHAAGYPGGLFGTSMSDEAFAQMAFARGRAPRGDHAGIGFEDHGASSLSYSNWLDANTHDAFGPIGSGYGGRLPPTDIQSHPHHSTSPYSANPDLASVSPTVFPGALPPSSFSAVQARGMPTSSAVPRSSTAFGQAPHAHHHSHHTSPTPRPPPGLMPFPSAAPGSRPDTSFHDGPYPSSGAEMQAPGPYASNFDAYVQQSRSAHPQPSGMPMPSAISTSSSSVPSPESAHRHPNTNMNTQRSPTASQRHHHEPINFLQMLQPTANPPYDEFVNRIVTYSDQQASVFLQQKMKVASPADRFKIVTAIAMRGLEMMTHRFGNWAVQRCLEAPCTRDDRNRLVSVMKGHVVELATNCYGTHVIQKSLDCEEEIKLFILTELLKSDPYNTLMNKHSAHVWSRIMELSWSDPAPPIFPFVNKALRGRWVDLACHETGSLVVQHAFENLDEADTRDLVNEIMQNFDRIVCDAWGSWVVQHLLEHGSDPDRSRALDIILDSLHIYGTDSQALKSVDKAIKCGGPDVLNKIVGRLCEPGSSRRRAMLVDLALNPVGSQLIALILPAVSKDQGTTLYDAIKKHVVTLKGSKSGSRVTWLFDKMRAYYGY